MREIDPAATEFGPEGFLPTEPEAMADVLARHQLHAIDGFTLLLLHRPDHDPQRHVIGVLERNATTGAAHVGALRRQRLAGYDTRPTLDDEAWATLDRIDAVAAKHPCARGAASARWNDDRERRRGAAAARGLLHPCAWTPVTCSSAGTDPAELTRQVPQRIAHTHIKDVDLSLGRQVQSGAHLHRGGP